MSGAKIMAQKTNWMKIQVPQKVVTLAILAKGHNSPAKWARELFKSSKVSESLVVSNKKFFWGLGFLVDDVMIGKGLVFLSW